MFTELQQMRQQLPDMEFGRRMAVERELEKVDGIRLTNIIFDETGHFVLYGTMLGIKVINVETNRYVHMKGETVINTSAVPSSQCSPVVLLTMLITISQIHVKGSVCRQNGEKCKIVYFHLLTKL